MLTNGGMSSERYSHINAPALSFACRWRTRISQEVQSRSWGHPPLFCFAPAQGWGRQGRPQYHKSDGAPTGGSSMTSSANWRPKLSDVYPIECWWRRQSARCDARLCRVRHDLTRRKWNSVAITVPGALVRRVGSQMATPDSGPRFRTKNKRVKV